MSKYNLDDSNGVRLDYCNLQATAVQVKECQTEYKAWLSDHDTLGILIMIILFGIFGFGFACGRVSAS